MSIGPFLETVLFQATDSTTTQSGGASSPISFDPFPAWLPLWADKVVLSLVVLVLASLVSQLLVQLAGPRIARRYRRPSLTRMARRLIRFCVFAVAVLTILGIYGLGLPEIGLSVAVFTAVLGVVLAPIVGSFISGVFLLADQPYEIGDMIELSGTDQIGFVEDITIRYTKMFTLDNTSLVIPNGTMRERDVVNYSADDLRTRLHLDVLITFESDVGEARRRIESAAREIDVVITGGPNIRIGAARYPAAPICYIDSLMEHGVRLRLRYWVKEPYRLLTARSKVQTAVYEAFAGTDLKFAYPHSHLHVDDSSGQIGLSMDAASESAGPMIHGIDTETIDASIDSADETSRDAETNSGGRGS